MLSESLVLEPLGASAVGATVAVFALDWRGKRCVGAGASATLLAGLRGSAVLKRRRWVLAVCAFVGVVGGLIAAVVITYLGRMEP
jgi:ABC-type Co2+ transport system permease subunit